MQSTSKNTMKIPFIIVLTSVVLSFCILIGTVSAWLMKDYTHESIDNQIGSVEVELYANGNKIEGSYVEENNVTHWVCNTPYEITGSTVERTNLNLTMRNNGTINALVRATISIYYYEDESELEEVKDKVLLLVSHYDPANPSAKPTARNHCILETTDWVFNFANDHAIDGVDGSGITGIVGGGQMFYNKEIAPYTIKEIASDIPGGAVSYPQPDEDDNGNPLDRDENLIDVPIINGIRLHESMANKTIYIDITLDAIAYSGNIYKKIKEYNDKGKDFLEEIDEAKYGALPYGKYETLPSGWTAWQ